jgi:hypothetical protein
VADRPLEELRRMGHGGLASIAARSASRSAVGTISANVSTPPRFSRSSARTTSSAFLLHRTRLAAMGAASGCKAMSETPDVAMCVREALEALQQQPARDADTGRFVPGKGEEKCLEEAEHHASTTFERSG